jgi:hypothetical protein
MDKFLDALAIFLWILAALSPILVPLFCWRRFKKMQPAYRVLIGLLIGAALGALLFWIGLSIVFRDGIRLF